MRSKILCLVGVFLALAAGATAYDVVVDNDETAPSFNAPPYEENGTWTTSGSTGYNGGIYRFSLNDDPPSSATWSVYIPTTGQYEVSTLFLASTNRATDAPWTVDHAGGSTTVDIDMSAASIQMAEVYIGEFTFTGGTTATITLNNETVGTTAAYIADAVRVKTAVDDPPVISAIDRTPSYVTFSDYVTITAELSDDVSVSSATLYYSTSPGGLSGSVAMADDGASTDGAASDGVWGGTIPPMASGETVTYYIEAEDSGSNITTSINGNYLVNAEPKKEFRGIWADTWNASIQNATYCDDLIATAREHNFNAVVVEVRKIGDAYYDSNYEPRATNISGGPTFDPLDYLIGIAHDTSGGKKYIEVHAWFVMHRIWTGAGSKPAGHVLLTNPEYQMSTSTGATTAGTTEYLDPGHPGAVNHNINVIIDCMQNYDIDGVNLDYIRYPEYSGEWGYNSVSVARFNAFYGKSGQPSGSDPDWDDWRRSNVTNEVKKLYVKMMQLDPSVVLTACTVNWGFDWNNWTSSSAYAGVFQDWVGWLEEGVLDYNMLMNYSNQNTYPTRYQGWTDLSLASDDIRGSYIGNGAYLQDELADSTWQIDYALDQGADGIVVYDWGSEVNANDYGATRDDFYDAVKAANFSDWADPPEPAWKTTPTMGVFEGTVTDSSVEVDHATVTIDELSGMDTYSDGSGWYGILEVPPGTYTLRASAPGKIDVTYVRTISAGDVLTVDFDFAITDVSDWSILDL